MPFVIIYKSNLMQQLRSRQLTTTKPIPKSSPQFINSKQPTHQHSTHQPITFSPPPQYILQNQTQVLPTINIPLVSKIHMQISHIEQINRELFAISQRIKSINHINSKSTSVPIIGKIQADFSNALNQLIQTIMQFHTEIDVKLINLGHFVEKQFGKAKIENNSAGPSKIIIGNSTKGGLTQNQINTMIQQTTDAKYEVLAQRIRGLEVSLRQTQLNQKKLIQVIQNMMQRYQISDQPTLIRQTPSLQDQFRRNRAATSATNIHYKRQQRSNSKNTKATSSAPTNLSKPENKNKSIYQNLYTIEQSVVNEEIQPQDFRFRNQQQPHHFRLRQIQQQESDNQIFIKKLYSAPQNSYHNQSKRSLRGHAEQGSLYHSVANKQEKSTASQQSLHDDKQHRLDYMMGRLNL